MDELLDVLDERGSPTGEVVWKSEAHRRGLFHRCFHCWVVGEDAAGYYLLVQRRDLAKDTWPGYLDVTAAGHLRSGEEPLAGGLRELEEELGLRVEPGRLVFLGTRRIEQKIPQGRDREFHDIFLLLEGTPPGDLRLQEGEVEAVLRLGLDEVQALGAGQLHCALAKEYAGGEASDKRVRLSDFVPNQDDYLRRVAGAARRVLAGEEPGPVF